MAFTPEDGTGLAASNSYSSLAAFKAYWDERGFAYSPTYSDPQIQFALVAATDFMEAQYFERWIGYRASSAQALAWPRICAYNDVGVYESGVPAKVVQACINYARAELEVPGALRADPEQDPTGRDVYRRREKVGPIEEDATYSEGPVESFAAYTIADNLLVCYLVSQGGTSYRA